jgi:hypothetical protein
VAAAVTQGGGLALRIQKDNDGFTQQGKGFGAIGQSRQRHDGMPELAKNGLLGDQHEALLTR